MKFGAKPRKIWNSARELNGKFNGFYLKFNRLMVLDHAWTQLTGPKAHFWQLIGVKGNTLYVSVKLAVARNELIASRDRLIKELNKHFDKPWIEKIEIAKDAGVSHE